MFTYNYYQLKKQVHKIPKIKETKSKEKKKLVTKSWNIHTKKKKIQGQGQRNQKITTLSVIN